ncbi:MAG: hypothetical protein ACTHKY_13945, partial [Ginsengibacter sp.]
NKYILAKSPSRRPGAFCSEASDRGGLLRLPSSFCAFMTERILPFFPKSFFFGRHETCKGARTASSKSKTGAIYWFTVFHSCNARN